MKNKLKKTAKYSLAMALLVLTAFCVYYLLQKPPTDGDWQPQLAVSSTAKFEGDKVTIENVRNFRYWPEEKDQWPDYYTKTYDLNTVNKVWYTSEPFNENKYAAHTYLSFEFDNGDFLAITIEARKTQNQTYSTWKGLLHTYPLIYIAADERDVTLLRANIRKDNVYVYPVKLSRPENARILLTDMLNKMNDIQAHPQWYNTLWRNCTSQIAWHVNRITPGRISPLSWQLLVTSKADELALKHGLLDTGLNIEEARKKFSINKQSLLYGNVEDYSKYIRMEKQ